MGLILKRHSRYSKRDPKWTVPLQKQKLEVIYKVDLDKYLPHKLAKEVQKTKAWLIANSSLSS